MDAQHQIEPNKPTVNHFDAHALYGMKMAEATKKAADQIYHPKRSWIVSRSNFIGMGQFAGHWSGDNYATWEQHSSSVLDMNMFGIPYTGADVCGFLLIQRRNCVQVGVYSELFIRSCAIITHGE